MTNTKLNKFDHDPNSGTSLIVPSVVRDCSDIAEGEDLPLTDDTQKGYSYGKKKGKKSRKPSSEKMAPVHTTSEMESAMSRMGGKQIPMQPMGRMSRGR